MTKSTQFFPFSLFLFLSFSLVFCLSPSLFSFLRIIYYGFFYHFLHPRVSQLLEVLFFRFSCPRTWSKPSQAFFTSSRSVTFISSFAGRPRILSYPRTGYWAQPFLMQSVHTRLDIGPSLLQCNLNIWDQLPPTIVPQNLAFRLLGRKWRFWFPRLICLMIWFHWVKSQYHVFVFLWLIPGSSVPRACLHLILATPLSPMFNGWMIIQRRLSFLGIWASEFPLLIFAPL